MRDLGGTAGDIDRGVTGRITGDERTGGPDSNTVTEVWYALAG